MDWLSKQYNNLKNAVVGPAQQALPSSMTQPASTQVGTAPETPGYTSAGGKRVGKKTRRSKKSKKTMRRKH